MKHSVFLTSLLFLLPLFFLVSCDDDDARVPSVKLMTAQEFMASVEGKGWQYVESHEIKSNGNIDKSDWWYGIDGAGPNLYSFSGDELTTYMYLDAYPIDAYTTRTFTFDGATNSLMADGEVVFTVVSVDENTLRLILPSSSTEGTSGANLYAVYRAMTADELSATKEKYSINLNTLDQDYPLIPAQETITAESFAANIVGSTWHCAEVHETFLTERYEAEPFTPDWLWQTPPDYEFTADSLYTITPSSGGAEATREGTTYTYRSNGFYVETASGDIIRILRLTADEMVAIVNLRQPAGRYDVDLYCVYKR